MVKDGTTVIIGGLRKEEDSSSNEGFPVLGKIPLLKLVFKNGYNTKTRTELVVLLTPHIISGLTFSSGEKGEFDQREAGDYRQYESIANNTPVMYPPAAPQLPGYRGLSLKEQEGEGGFSIKGQKYDIPKTNTR